MTGDLRRALLLAASEEDEHGIACLCEHDHAGRADKLMALAGVPEAVSVAYSPAGSPS